MVFGDLARLAGEIVGTAGGIAIAPLAIALGITEEMVKQALDSGCKTVAEIKEFWDLD